MLPLKDNWISSRLLHSNDVFFLSSSGPSLSVTERRRAWRGGQNWTSLVLVYMLLHSNTEHLRFSFTYRTNPYTRQLFNSVQNSPYMHQHIPRKRLQASSCCYKIKKDKKKRERNSELKGNKDRSRSHDWPKTEAPCITCEVAAFLCGAEGINETVLRSERTSTRFLKNLPIMGSEMWYVFDFSWKIAVIVVQSGLKLYDLTVIAAGVQMNGFVNLIAPFAHRWQRSHHVFVWSNWRQN